jgi:hypothetical protein
MRILFDQGTPVPLRRSLTGRPIPPAFRDRLILAA